MATEGSEGAHIVLPDEEGLPRASQVTAHKDAVLAARWVAPCFPVGGEDLDDLQSQEGASSLSLSLTLFNCFCLSLVFSLCCHQITSAHLKERIWGSLFIQAIFDTILLSNPHLCPLRPFESLR